MALKDLQDKLSDTNWEIEQRQHEQSQYDPSVASQAGTEEFKGEKAEWGEVKKGLQPYQIKRIKIGLAIIGLFAVTLIGFVLYVFVQQSFFSENRVKVNIEGPEVVASVEQLTYKVKFENDNRAALNNAKLLFNYPENFKPVETGVFKKINSTNGEIVVGEIKPHSTGEVEIKGSFFAPKDYSILINAKLQYEPTNFSSTFESEGKLGINVKTPPLVLEVTSPLEAASGNDVEYVIQYQNVTDAPGESNMRIQVDYPDDFELVTSDPAPSEGNSIWHLGQIGPNEKGEIKIKGILSGREGEIKTIKAHLGSLTESNDFIEYDVKEKLTNMIGSPLYVAQSINGLTGSNIAVNSGQILTYQINYKNQGEVGLRDAIITMDIDSPVLDYSSIVFDDDEEGAFDESTKTITWKAANVPEIERIEVGGEGEITMRIKVKERLPVETANDKNFVITSVVKMDSPDIPSPVGSNKIIASNTIAAKVNSKVVLDVKALYNDANISNSGPVPMRVGEETTATINWDITNVNNDISEAQVVSYLPSWVKWTDKIYPIDEDIYYNERSNRIVWEVGKLPSAIGVLNDKKSVKFQISIIPQVNQANTYIDILNPTTLTAKDLFTNNDVRIELPSEDSELSDDVSVSHAKIQQ